MTFKKILSLLLVLCMIFTVAACAGKDKDDDDDDSKSSSGKKGGIFSKINDSDSNDDEDEDKDEKDSDDEDSKDKDSDDKDVFSNDDNPYAGLKEVDLPKDFPKDIFPIYKDGIVFAADKGERDGIGFYSIMAVFNTDMETVGTFYKEKIKDAENLEDQSTSDFTYFTGTLGSYEFSLSLASDSTNKKYSILTLELTAIPTVDDLLKSLSKAELPEKYPVDLFPIIDGAALYDARESVNDGKTSYSLTIYTDKSFKDIIAFYEEKIGTSEDIGKSISTDYFDLDGTAHNYYFYISGDLTEENGVEVVRYYLNLDPAN